MQRTLDDIHWDDLRILLACAAVGTFRGAARDLGINPATVTRRMERLERGLGARLFNRVPDGIVLTCDGQLFVDGAKGVERALHDFGRKSLAQQTAKATVTIAVTEGLGSYWVMPQLVEFQRERPNVTVNLLCAMASVDVLRLEADIAIQFTQPQHKDLIVSKLGPLHVYPFASESYLRTYGTPKSAADFANHRYVQQVAPQLDDDHLAGYFGLDAADLNVGIRTNASTAHLYAIEKGAGIGVLPNYAMALGAPVVPVDVAARYAIDIWLTYHQDMKSHRPALETIRWLRGIFSSQTYPWFGDKFLHPSAIGGRLPRQAEFNRGEGFLAVEPPLRSQGARRKFG